MSFAIRGSSSSRAEGAGQSGLPASGKAGYYDEPAIEHASILAWSMRPGPGPPGPGPKLCSAQGLAPVGSGLSPCRAVDLGDHASHDGNFVRRLEVFGQNRVVALDQRREDGCIDGP